jgi:ribosome-binding factor A
MERAAEAIRETVSTTVLFGLRDPRIRNVTVLGAEVSPDLKAAKIFVTVMGDAKSQSLAMHGLASARGFVQAKIAERLQTKNTPIIKFVLDPSVKKSIATSKALSEASQDSPELVVDGDLQESDVVGVEEFDDSADDINDDDLDAESGDDDVMTAGK